MGYQGIENKLIEPLEPPERLPTVGLICCQQELGGMLGYCYYREAECFTRFCARRSLLAAQEGKPYRISPCQKIPAQLAARKSGLLTRGECSAATVCYAPQVLQRKFVTSASDSITHVRYDDNHDVRRCRES